MSRRCITAAAVVAICAATVTTDPATAEGTTMRGLQDGQQVQNGQVASVAVSRLNLREPLFMPPRSVPELPLVVANDNRTPAGSLSDGVLVVELDVMLADFRAETDDGPGFRVEAIAERGKAPMVPAPLIRVTEGTRIHVRIRNLLPDSTIMVRGLETRPSEDRDSLVIAPGASGQVEFLAGAAGTYFYSIRPSLFSLANVGERQQLDGALVVDPVGGSPPDRIFVINIWGHPVDSTLSSYGYVNLLTINGKSWPYTEIERPQVGETLRWRIVNASARNHPMHLHGFFYDVLSRGDMNTDDRYAPGQERTVVTEFMRRRTTMLMEWTPSRPGKWLFHCHLSFHVGADNRPPRADELDAERGLGHVHMAGLVIGIDVPPGDSDLIARGEPDRITLRMRSNPADSLHEYGFSIDRYGPGKSSSVPESRGGAPVYGPGPPIVLTQYRQADVKVVNEMDIPSGIHWHGLELDSWADGVPQWSASDGKMSPVIEPGESFTYRLSSMRPGTFMYHTHLDDAVQLTHGLYGPLIVMPPGEEYDPATDHIFMFGWRTDDPSQPDDFELNGRTEEPDVLNAIAGETHRIRLIHIAPAGRVSIAIEKDGESVPLLRYVAKDGADLPPGQQVMLAKSPRYGVGEAADFTFTPDEAGTYIMVMGYGGRKWRQTWEVAEGR